MTVRDEGRIGVTPEALRQWARGLRSDDQVALEATGNSDAIANLLTPLVDSHGPFCRRHHQVKQADGWRL